MPDLHRRLPLHRLVGGLALAGLLAACGADNTPSAVGVAGKAAALGTRVLDAGAALLQDKPPIGALNAYLDGFHFYSGRMQAQMEAHHYCAILGEELIQCVIYDGNTPTAKLMGVEYIISQRQFEGLPAPEKALWHSHVHEVKSGQLIAPGLPEAAEHALMAKLVSTYGKTWHTWHTDQDKGLPLGAPQLMMGFTADGQVDAAMVAARDERFGVRSQEKRQGRADIAAPAIAEGANAWEKGHAVQIPDLTGAHALMPAAAAHAPGPQGAASSGNP